MRFRALAGTRLIAEMAMGNSQQFKDDYGWDYGWPYAMSQYFPVYATEVYPRGSNVSPGYNVSYQIGASDGTRPTQFDPYLLPGVGDPAAGAEVPGYQAANDIGTGQGIILSGDGSSVQDGIDHRHRLRLRARYGTFPSGSGHFQLFIRSETSPFGGIVQGAVINTNTGAYGFADTTLDLPADPARTGPLGFKWRPIGGANASVGPTLQVSMQVEDLDVQAGYSLTTLYAVSGMSMRTMATYMSGMADAQLRNILQATVQTQIDRGQSPMMIFAVNEGENFRNDPTDSSAAAYIAQFDIVWKRLQYGWDVLCGFPPGNLACELRCGVPLSDPQDAKLASYDVAADAYAATDYRVNHYRFLDSTSYAYMVANNLFLDGLHLVPAGYTTLTLRDLNLHMPKVAAVNRTLPAIAGVRGLGQTLTVTPGTWFQTPALTYQWYADGVAIASATGTSLTETAAQAGKALTVVETASINGLVSTATSASLSDTTSFIADYGGGSYYLTGTSYADEASFNLAAGITKTGNVRVSAPVVIGSELVVNGTFDTDASGWSASATVSLSVASQKLRITRSTTGQAQWGYQSIPVEIGRAYRLGWDAATVSGSAMNVRAGPAIGASTYGQDGTTGVGKVMHIAPQNIALVFSAGDANTANSGVGDIDNVSCREEVPFPGYSGIGHTVVLGFTTDATLPSSNQVLWQEDLGSESNRRRVAWETDGHIWVRFTIGGTEVAALDMGAVAISTNCNLAIAYAQNDFVASLNGGAVVVDSAGNLPGAHILRIGRSFTGEAWAGAIGRVQHRNSRLANASLVALSTG